MNCFYDTDKHIIKVAEKLDAVILRLAKQGFPTEKIADRMDIPLDFVLSRLTQSPEDELPI